MFLRREVGWMSSIRVLQDSMSDQNGRGSCDGAMGRVSWVVASSQANTAQEETTEFPGVAVEQASNTDCTASKKHKASGQEKRS
jgi:hypothetical protein